MTACLLTGMLMCSFNVLNKPSNLVRTVVIDAGHGGKDPGCLGKYSMEKDIALEIAYEVATLIQTYHPDVRIIMTRDQKHQFIELRERALIANRAQADLFISIHCNAHPLKRIFGTETYVMGLGASEENNAVAMRENSAILKEDRYETYYDGFDPTSPVAHILLSNFQNAFKENSLKLATHIEKQFVQKGKRQSRGVKQAGFLVLAKTTMPGVLVEVGFLTNEEEENYLNSPSGKSNVASSIYRAFRDYKEETEGS